MTNQSTIGFGILLLSTLCISSAGAALTATNRVAVSARTGFNLKADFGYAANRDWSSARTTPSGDSFNYDDGYVYADSSGSGATWYWGYDDAAQDTGSELLLSRTTVQADSGISDLDRDEPFVGAEVTYSYVLETEESFQFGYDFSVGCLPLEFDGRARVTAENRTVTDGYAYNPADTLPTAPYEGSFAGGGTLIQASPSSSATTTTPGESYDVRSELEGDLWSARIGPCMELPVNDWLALHFSFGLALGYLDVDAAWSTTAAVPTQGGGSDSDWLSGAFLGTDIYVQLAEKWHLTGGIEFEYLNDWTKDFGNGTYRLDLTRSCYASLGILREF